MLECAVVGYTNKNKGKTIKKCRGRRPVANVVVETCSRRRVLAASIASSSSA